MIPAKPTSFTKGEWIITPDALAVYALTAGVNRFYARIERGADCSNDEAEANVRLFAAAPKMFALLERYLNAIENGALKTYAIDDEARELIKGVLE